MADFNGKSVKTPVPQLHFLRKKGSIRLCAQWGLFTLVVLGLVLVLPGYAQFPSTPQHNALMERKLTSTQQVLAGIARENFDDVERQAHMLRLLSQEAGWNVLQTPDYRRLSEDFRGTTKQLEIAAQEKNLDAVGLAFVKLSISCIDCHRHAKKELARIGEKGRRGKPTILRR